MARPRKNVRDSLQKARESALQSVGVYNHPSSPFRTGAYVVLMVIAWTSLFHAIFFKRQTKPFYRLKNSNRFVRQDGDIKWWDLSECIAQYYGGADGPERKNLEFFARLRNKIEHRLMPELDPMIFGECQALLLNFDRLLAAEFGSKNALSESLYFSLQFAAAQPMIPRGTPSAGWPDVSAFVQAFRSSLSAAVHQSNTYSWQVYLLPRIGNHRSSADIAVEWIKYDPDNAQEMERYEQVAALIKTKHVAVYNLNGFKPSQVCTMVETAIGKKFSPSYHHAIAWRRLKVRPESNATDPSVCQEQYCVYDRVHRDYVYTQDWVDLLIGRLSQTAGYEEMFPR